MDIQVPAESILRRHGWTVVTILVPLLAALFIFSVVYRPLPRVAIGDVAAPPTKSVVLGPRMTLGSIAASAYGHEQMGAVLQRFCHIQNDERIPDGTLIPTPSLPLLFQQAGLDPRYQPMVNVLAKALQDYSALVPVYERERSAAGPPRLSRVPLSNDLVEKMAGISRAGETACRSLRRAVRAPHAEPKLAFGQFQQAFDRLHGLSLGLMESEDYDTETVFQHLALGFGNLLGWVQQNYR